MQTLIKWAGILVGVVIGLAVLLSVVVWLFVDIEDYREDIAKAVSEATGRTLTIGGELSLTSFPCCGVRIGNVELSNAPGFDTEHFAKASSASVSVRILPLLLSQELKIDELTVQDLDLRLLARRDGSVNWSFGEPEAEVESTEDTGGGLNDLDIGGISIRNSRVVYRDEATGTEIVLTGLNFETGAINGAAPFDLSAELGALGLVEGAAAEIRISSEARVDLDKTVLNLNGLNIDAALSGKDLPSGQVAFVGKIDAITDIGGDVIAISGVDGELKVADMQVNLSGDGGYDAAGIAFTGKLEAPGFSPRDVLAALGEEAPITADPDVLKQMQFAGAIAVAGDTARLDGLQIELDDTQLSGFAELTSIEREAIRFDLNVDQLDLDRYLEPEAESDDAWPNSEDDSEEDALPIDTLKALDLNGELAIGALTVSGVKLTNANITVKAGDGNIRLRPLTAELYGGTYSGDVRLNLQRYVPKLSVEENITGVQIGDFLGDFLDAESSLVGKGNLRFVGSGDGRSAGRLIETITGTLVLSLEEGRYLGMDIWYEVRNVYAGLKGEARPAVPESPFTPIETMQATAKVKRGMQIENEQLKVQIPFMAVDGSGLVDLNNFTLDYKLAGRVTEKPVFEDGTELKNLEGLGLGLGLSGDIDDPDVKVDLGALAGSVAKSALEKEKDKQLDRLLKKLGGDEEEPAKDGVVGDAPAESESNATEPAGEEAPDSRDQLRKSLKDLLDR